MSLKRYIIILFTILSFTLELNAQINTLPKRTIGGSEFYYYKVKAKETIYGISKKFNITKEDMIKYNPSLVDGLKKDYILLFPASAFPTIPTKDEDNNIEVENFTHVVAKGETLYGLSKTYNVSQEAIIELNPSAERGLKSGQTLIIPQPKSKENDNNNTASITDNYTDSTKKERQEAPTSEFVFHTIQKGETLFGLSKKYDTTIEKILELNPGISPSNFKTGEVVKVSPNSLKPELKEATVTEMIPYVAQKGDNFKSIAEANDIAEEDLIAANPNMSKVKKGKTVQLPLEKKDSILILPHEGTTTELQDNESERIKEIYDSVHDINSDNEINIALLLPYMLNKAQQSKQARLYTEFYKGFLMAIDDVSSNCGKKINIFTYDTEDSDAKLKAILDKEELKSMDMIFASEEISQIEEIGRFCKENKVYMINSFSLKTESYNENPFMFQVNIPQSFMHADVYDWFDSKFADYEVVFIHKKGTTKKDFANDLIAHVTQKNSAQMHQIEYNSTLVTDVFKQMLEPGKKYLLVPTSGTKAVMSQIAPAIKRIKADSIGVETAVLGYPEWVTYMEDWKESFHEIDTYIYSRFFVNPQDDKVERFEKKYEQWYGENMMNAVPRFGFLGYDTGMYFLKSLCNNGKDFNKTEIKYDGLQTNFKFERISNWSGFVNKSVYFIHFMPNGKLDITTR